VHLSVIEGHMLLTNHEVVRFSDDMRLGGGGTGKVLTDGKSTQ